MLKRYTVLLALTAAAVKRKEGLYHARVTASSVAEAQRMAAEEAAQTWYGDKEEAAQFYPLIVFKGWPAEETPCRRTRRAARGGWSRTVYPLADSPTLSEIVAIGPNLVPRFGTKFMFDGTELGVSLTGEYRRPRKGEWYVSGAIPEAYRALHDLSEEHRIARLIHVAPLSITVEVKRDA